MDIQNNAGGYHNNPDYDFEEKFSEKSASLETPRMDGRALNGDGIGERMSVVFHESFQTFQGLSDSQRTSLNCPSIAVHSPVMSTTNLHKFTPKPPRGPAPKRSELGVMFEKTSPEAEQISPTTNLSMMSTRTSINNARFRKASKKVATAASLVRELTRKESDEAFGRKSHSGSVTRSSFMHTGSSLLPKEIEKLENTFQLEPAKKIPIKEAQERVQLVLDQFLEGEVYEPTYIKQLCVNISDEVQHQLVHDSDLLPKRYKVVTQVFLGQRFVDSYNCADVQIASKMFSDAKRDNFCTARATTATIYGTCIVFFLYTD